MNAIDGVGGEAITSGEVVPEIVSGSRDGSVKVSKDQARLGAPRSLQLLQGSTI